MLIEYGVLIVIALIAGVAGWGTHEGTHYVFGCLSGGQPFFDRRIIGIPTRVDFDRPEEMSDRQTKITGGIVVIFPVVFAFLLGVFAVLVALGLKFEAFGLIVAAAFFAGGSGVSWLDMLALYSPENWKAFTSGEPICRSDFE